LTSRQYIIRTIGATLLMAVAFAAVNFSVDIFGLFRSTKDRPIKNYLVERTAKYLFARCYIPENFDGLLIGSSVSDNVSTRYIRGQRIYNASLNSANITEVALVADEAMKRKKFEVIIICLNHYLVKDHGRKTSYMYPHEYWEALGSPQLIMTYFTWAWIKLGRRPDYYDEMGCYRLTLDKLPKSSTELIRERVVGWETGNVPAAQQDDKDDAVAWEELAQLVIRAQVNAGLVLVYYPPIPESILQHSRKDYERFRVRSGALFSDSAVILNFNAPEYEGFRTKDANFRDSTHLSEAGSLWLAHELDQVVNAGAKIRPGR
jgi:hypothetical protein